MDVSTLLADPSALRLDAFVSNNNSINIRVHCTQQQSICPSCGVSSNSLHSNYVRSVADLPWHNVPVALELHTRKFRCRSQLCSQKIFCERVPKVIERYARRTVRLETLLTWLAFASGGEAGARTARRLKLEISGDTLLKMIRRKSAQSAFDATEPEPRVIGVDDWAWRKGHSYGTIIVDLERRKAIDLLPDREAETLAQWLREHQTVETVARDRSPTYRCGIVEGQPDAIQVADRWHLLKNLADTLKSLIERLQRKKKPAVPSGIDSFDSAQTVCAVEPNFDLPQRQWEEQLQTAIEKINRQKRHSRLLQHLSADGFAKKRTAAPTMVIEHSGEQRAPVNSSIKQSRSRNKIDTRALIRLCLCNTKPSDAATGLLDEARNEWEEFDRAYPLPQNSLK